MYLLSPAGWHISPPNRNERREEKNRLCSAHKCKVCINTECQGSSGEANRPAIARMTQFPDFCSKQNVLVKRGSSKDCSCKDLLPLSFFPFFFSPTSFMYLLCLLCIQCHPDTVRSPGLMKWNNLKLTTANWGMFFDCVSAIVWVLDPTSCV